MYRNRPPLSAFLVAEGIVLGVGGGFSDAALFGFHQFDKLKNVGYDDAFALGAVEMLLLQGLALYLLSSANQRMRRANA